jgi:Fur family ferric uptake transcriptional regulator
MTETQSPIDIDAKIAALNRFLSQKGLKSTRQRDLIAQIVLESHGHIGVEDIYRKVRKKDAKVGFSTVYRTMKLLKDSGLVLERHFGDGLARYEPMREGEHHDHLICVRCNEIVEFEDEDIERRQEAVAERHGYSIQSHKHEIYGLCPACSGKQIDQEMRSARSKGTKR